jgi:shikimate dehydrogenase
VLENNLIRETKMTVEKNYKAELVGVFGYPVAENPTIIMQEAAFKALGLNFRYLNIEVRPEDLQTAFQGLRAFNMKGINLTIPHKVEVLKYLDVVADDARLIGAVNTVYRQGNQLFGENTDGKGFITSLRLDAAADPKGKKVVVLGAGGAARAITVELALAGASQITVVNRDKKRGLTLVNLLNAKTQTPASFVPWDSTYAIPDGTDVLVNATSIGLYPDINARPNLDYDTIRPGMIVCDVIPNPPHTILLKEAQKRGAKTLDGLGMLVHQGTIGFKIWTGMEAPVEVMKTALMNEFGLI